MPTDCRTCVRVSKENRTQDFGRPANLAQPVGPGIGRSKNLSVLSNRGTGQRISERLAIKYVYGTMLLIFPAVSSVGCLQDDPTLADRGRGIGIRHGNSKEPLGSATVVQESPCHTAVGTLPDEAAVSHNGSIVSVRKRNAVKVGRG